MKKSKLLLSLAMMCLSIVVLCFGVLAATSVTYSISGTISYTVTDVFVKINTSVFGVKAQQDKATVIANVKTLETKALDSIADSTYTLTQTMVEYDSSSATGETVTHTAQTSESKGVEIVYGGDNGYYTYYIVINIQNLSTSKNVYAKVTDTTTADLNSIKTTNEYQNAITSNETKNIVIAYSIKDKTQGIDSTTAQFNYSLLVNYRDTDYTNEMELIKDTEDGGYYVILGKRVDLSTMTATDVNMKWELISLDGETKYTYTNGNDNLETRYLSGAIFLMENSFVKGNFANSSSETKNVYIGSNVQKNIVNCEIYPTIIGLSGGMPSCIKKYYDTSELNGKVEGDRFWLLSKTQVETFFDTQAETSLKDDSNTEVAWWTRTAYPNSTDKVYISGNTDHLGYSTIYMSDIYVRAAFQLV